MSDQICLACQYHKADYIFYYSYFCRIYFCCLSYSRNRARRGYREKRHPTITAGRWWYGTGLGWLDMLGLVRFLSQSPSICVCLPLWHLHFECSQSDSWHVLQKPAGTGEKLYRWLCGRVMRRPFHSSPCLLLSFCGRCCQTIVTTCRHSHELYVLSDTSAQISQGLKFVYIFLGFRGFWGSLRTQRRGGPSMITEWSIGLPHRTRSSITVCGGVPSKVAYDRTKTNTPAEGSFNSRLITSGTSAVPLFWLLAVRPSQICIHYIYGTILLSKRGNKKEHLCPGPRLTSGISFSRDRTIEGSIDGLGWSGSFAE